ncbi:MAG: branched-chain amino acid ABC transporter permease [Chloroflexi bacterium]|nr:branched-chain amino acid ABC transporter permease [Chloroflexota bacterium]
MNLAILAVGTLLAIVAARQRSPASLRRSATGALFALMALAPFVSDTTSILFDALTAMCVAYGWNVIGGYTGYASFGNVAYLGLGAFIAAGFMSRQPGHLALPWYVGIPLAVILVALAAGALGLAVLRLRGHYFSIATLGIAVAMPQFIQWDLLFGPKGPLPNFFGGGRPLNFPLADDLTLGGITFPADRFLFYYLGLATALIGWGVTAWLSRRKFGYSLVAIRENEEAAEVMGIDTTRNKVLSYMLSAALAALGGSVIGYRLTNMTTEAEALFSTANNLQMIIICLIGGVGTVWGPWIGAFILFAIQEALRVGSTSNAFLEWQAIVFSILIVLVVLFLPRGLLQFVHGRVRVTWRLLFRNLEATRV